MKGLLLSLIFLLGASVVTPVQAALAVKTAESSTIVEDLPAETKQELRKKERQERRAQRKAVRSAFKEWRKEKVSDDMLLIIIITILLPPLGMFLYEGDLTTRVLISLLLWLLFYLPGLIYTLVVILG